MYVWIWTLCVPYAYSICVATVVSNVDFGCPYYQLSPLSSVPPVHSSDRLAKKKSREKKTQKREKNVVYSSLHCREKRLYRATMPCRFDNFNFCFFPTRYCSKVHPFTPEWARLGPLPRVWSHYSRSLSKKGIYGNTHSTSNTLFIFSARRVVCRHANINCVQTE